VVCAVARMIYKARFCDCGIALARVRLQRLLSGVATELSAHSVKYLFTNRISFVERLNVCLGVRGLCWEKSCPEWSGSAGAEPSGERAADERWSRAKPPLKLSVRAPSLVRPNTSQPSLRPSSSYI
jgi:hypothetical protein